MNNNLILACIRSTNLNIIVTTLWLFFFFYYPIGVYDLYMRHDIQKRASHRSKIIKGQFDGLQKMIDNEEYCMDILTQRPAIQKSLAPPNTLIVENHITTHVTEMLSSGDKKQHEQAHEELLRLYELSNVRSK